MRYLDTYQKQNISMYLQNKSRITILVDLDTNYLTILFKVLLSLMLKRQLTKQN